MTDGNISECIIISDPLCKDDNARFSIVPLKPVSLPNYTPSPPAPASAAPGPSPPAPAGGPPTAPTPASGAAFLKTIRYCQRNNFRSNKIS